MTKKSPKVSHYRYDNTRKHLPDAGLAGHGHIREMPSTRYSYDPHLPPVLHFEANGKADELPFLLEQAKKQPLNDEQVKILADALRNHQPWLEWAGKQEKQWFDVDPVALHVHERVSAQAIIAAAQRRPIQPSLFADPELEYHEAVKFYEHDVKWSNRLILGDSLAVMHSLAHREDLIGKVQMIYIDPPYGIKFASNFQPFVKNRTVGERQQDLTRELEQIKAYRDTWTLGIHSYLSYLRDRLFVCKELLLESGSIFVQINDKNLHRVRLLLDEVFGPENFVSVIAFKKTSSFSSSTLDNVLDFIVWYSKKRENMKFNQLLEFKKPQEQIGKFYDRLELLDGERRTIKRKELQSFSFPSRAKVFQASVLYSEGATSTGSYPIEFEGNTYKPPSNAHWKTNKEGMYRIASAGRLYLKGNTLRYVRYFKDYPYFPINNIWHDTSFGGFVGDQKKIYVVQTYTKVIERCMLMTTDPGDLVLDPTCGSGTTAYVAEQWGRRWITIDTSRVAVSLARQRLLTSSFDYYRLIDPQAGVCKNFVYETAPHITLGGIAQNQALDPIFTKWDPILTEKLDLLNAALTSVTPEIQAKLQTKFAQKEHQEGKRAITNADRRRWLLPKDKWKEWEVPFSSDPDWPPPLQQALIEYRQTWRAKMDEVNAAIAASAPQETLVNKPKVVKNVLRVSGPFTVEGIQPIEQSLNFESPISGDPDELETWQVTKSDSYKAETYMTEIDNDPINTVAYLEKIIHLLRLDGVRFPDNKVVKFNHIELLFNSSTVHAEGEWQVGGKTRRVAVSIGPQYGPITVLQVEDCLRFAYRRGYDDLVFAGFTIDGMAQATIADDPNPRVRCHVAYIRPDVNIGGDLLKDTPSSQLFTVSGAPRVHLETRQGEHIVHMEGVDIYDPIKNVLIPTNANKVAAWFLDTDYNGRTFNISQAFFPDSKAWHKIAKALKATIDPSQFAAFNGTTSLPFKTGKYKRAAVKVIDPRGNEVMKIVYLDGEVRYG